MELRASVEALVQENQGLRNRLESIEAATQLADQAAMQQMQVQLRETREFLMTLSKETTQNERTLREELDRVKLANSQPAEPYPVEVVPEPRLQELFGNQQDLWAKVEDSNRGLNKVLGRVRAWDEEYYAYEDQNGEAPSPEFPTHTQSIWQPTELAPGGD